MAGVGTALALAGLNRDLALSQVISQSSQSEAEKWRMEAERQSMARADMEARALAAEARATVLNAAVNRAIDRANRNAANLRLAHSMIFRFTGNAPPGISNLGIAVLTGAGDLVGAVADFLDGPEENEEAEDAAEVDLGGEDGTGVVEDM